MRDFLGEFEKELNRKQKAEKRKLKSYGVDWDEQHNWCMYWQKLESEALLKRRYTTQ